MPTPTPNYIDPPSRAAMVVGVNTAMISVAFCFVSLRCFTRFKLTSLGLDDYLICVAWLFSFAMSFCIALSTKYGTGRHVWDIPPAWFPMSGRLAYCFTAFYNPTLMMTKTSILAFYINKLGTERKFRRVCWGVMTYVICSSTSIFFANIFQCSPISGGWDRSVPGRKCINTTPLYYFSGANNLTTDLVLLFLPMPVIWKLKLPLRQKIGLVMVFSMGAFRTNSLRSVTGISIIRIHMVNIAVTSTDLSWTGAISSTWSGVELNVAIVCACMPAFKQFLSWIAPGIMGSTLKKSQYYNHTGSGGLKYHDGTGVRKSIHGLRSVGRSANGPNTTTITATHNNDSEEYIMHDLDGTSGSPTTGINKTVEVIVQSEAVKDSTSTQSSENRKSW